MRSMITACLITIALCVSTWAQPARDDVLIEQVNRFQQTSAMNIDELIKSQFRNAEPARGFSVVDPYESTTADTVMKWKARPGHESEVCALRFSGTDRVAYELQSFESPAAAVTAGFTITHHGRCGSCSTLQDLAVYLGTSDLTTPARQCARRFGLSRKRQCFEEEIGFTTYCSESWTYNARHTKKACRSTCIADYGLLNLLFHRYPGENVNQAGQLRPCLQCDEEQSGPGFKYSAGRTRRNSGIESAIPRPESEIYPVDHTSYFH